MRETEGNETFDLGCPWRVLSAAAGCICTAGCRKHCAERRAASWNATVQSVMPLATASGTPSKIFFSRRRRCGSEDSHSTTSSARLNNVGGNVIPNPAATLAFSTKRKLVVISTGKSAGFLPFNTLSIIAAPCLCSTPVSESYAMSPPASVYAKFGHATGILLLLALSATRPRARSVVK
jgi:hypothetical protein